MLSPTTRKTCGVFRLNKCVVVGFALLAASLLPSALGDESAVPPTTVDLDAYSGQWYNVADNRRNPILKFSSCNTATYEVFTSDECTGLTVANEGNRRRDPGGSQVTGNTGLACSTDVPNVFDLEFDQFGGGKYTIAALGPKIGGQYQYSIVTPPNCRSLFILARDIDEYLAMYQREAEATARSIGCRGKRKRPRPTLNDKCTYEWLQ